MSKPVATLSVPSTAQVGKVVMIDASESHDDGFIKTAQINFGDGSTLELGSGDVRPQPHIYYTTGEKKVTLSVVDNKRHAASATATVTVAEDVVIEPEPDTTVPVATLTFDPTTGVGEVTIEDNDTVVTCGVILGQAVVASGPAPLGFQVDMTTLTPGSHVLAATATDSAGNTGTASHVFEIATTEPEPEPEPLPKPQPIGDPWFDALITRPDFFHAISGRNRAEVHAYRKPAMDVYDYDYIYPDDPYPLKQDAMKIRVRPGQASPADGLSVPCGPSEGKSLLFVYDLFYGPEWDWDTGHRITGHKVGPVFFFGAGNVQIGLQQIQFNQAKKCPESLPPGGPFIGMLYCHLNVPGVVKNPNFWRGGQAGYPPSDTPYGAICTRRNQEAIQPYDTSVVPGGQEWGVVGGRWHRVWHFLERAPEEDWVSDHNLWYGQTMAAYKWSAWMADTEREPMRQINEALIGLPQGDSQDGWMRIASKYAVGGAPGAEAKLVVRDDLVSYQRNWITLHGTSKDDVLALLQKPLP